MDPGSQSLTSPTTSGFTSPPTGGQNLNIFNGGLAYASGGSPLPSLPGSRVPTPSIGGAKGEGKETLQRFGARFGIGSRLFGTQ